MDLWSSELFFFSLRSVLGGLMTRQHLAEALSCSCATMKRRPAGRARSGWNAGNLINEEKILDRLTWQIRTRGVFFLCRPFVGSFVYTVSVFICVGSLPLLQLWPPRTPTQSCELKKKHVKDIMILGHLRAHTLTCKDIMWWACCCISRESSRLRTNIAWVSVRDRCLQRWLGAWHRGTDTVI